MELKAKANEHLVAELQESLGVAKIVAELLVQRGITTFETAKTFFRPDLSHLHDPFLMKDMDSAVARLSTAIQQVKIYWCMEIMMLTEQPQYL